MSFSIQRGTVDVGNAGTTFAPPTAFGSLASTILIPATSRFTHAGPPTQTTDQTIPSMSGAMELTGTNQISIFRQSGSSSENMRFAWTAIEYTGAPGGADEFIVRDRVQIRLNNTSNPVSATISGVVDPDNCVVFITGATTDGSGWQLSISAYLTNATTVEAVQSDFDGDTTVYATIVEFTGSNWQIAHGQDVLLSADSGTIDLTNGFDFTGGEADIVDWDTAWIYGHALNFANESISSIGVPVLTPAVGDTTAVDWTFHPDHIGQDFNNDIRIWVIRHPDLVVTRFSDTQSAAGANSVNVTSAGLSGLESAWAWMTHTSSGTGTVSWGQGFANCRLTSTTNVEIWKHRSGATISSNVQIMDISALVDDGTLRGTSVGISAASGTLDVSNNRDVFVQRGIIDVPVAGTTVAPDIDFNSLSSTFAFLTNNRAMSAGPSSATGNQEIDDLSARLRVTAIDTLAFDRVAGSTTDTLRCAWESWEYVGPSGGANEFIIRDRVTVTLAASNSDTTTVSGIVNINRCIPFITGISSTETTDSADAATAIAWLSGSDVLNIRRGGTAGTTIVEITVVEFTGSNWFVTHGRLQSVADTGTITLVDAADGVTVGGGDVQDFGATAIFHQWRANDQNGVDDAISDTSATYVPGSNTTSVDFSFDPNHVDSAVGAAIAEHFVHCLTHAAMAVFRPATVTDSSEGAFNVDISTANLAVLDAASVIVSSRSSGTGTAYGRGWRNARLTSLTNCELWVHRSGNTVATEIQILDLSAIQTDAGQEQQLNGAADAEAGASGLLDLIRPFDGLSEGQGETIGALVRARSVEGQASALSGVAGSFDISRPLAGIATSISIATGQVVRGRGLEGAADAESAVAGQVVMSHILSGASTVLSTGLGALVRQFDLGGASTGISDVSGNVARVVFIDGVVNSISATSGQFNRQRVFEGQGAVSAVTQGALVSVRSLNGSADAVSGVVGTLIRTIPLSGSAIILSAAQGAVETTALLAGTAIADASAGGLITRARAIGGQASSFLTTQGVLNLESRASGQADALSLSTGLVDLPGDLLGVAPSISNTVGTLARERVLAGVATGQSATSGILGAQQIELAGTAFGVSIAQGSIGVGVLAGSADAASLNEGELVRERGLDGAATTAAIALGQLSSIELVGIAPSVSLTAGILDRIVGLTGSASAISVGAGTLNEIDLVGTATAISASAGTSQLILLVAGTATAQSVTAGNSNRVISLNAISNVQSATQGDVDVSVPLAGVAVAISDTAGQLFVEGAEQFFGLAFAVSDGVGTILRSAVLDGQVSAQSFASGRLDRSVGIIGISTALSSTEGLVGFLNSLEGAAISQSVTAGNIARNRGFLGLAAAFSDLQGSILLARGLRGVAAPALDTEGLLGLAQVLEGLAVASTVGIGALAEPEGIPTLAVTDLRQGDIVSFNRAKRINVTILTTPGVGEIYTLQLPINGVLRTFSYSAIGTETRAQVAVGLRAVLENDQTPYTTARVDTVIQIEGLLADDFMFTSSANVAVETTSAAIEFLRLDGRRFGRVRIVRVPAPHWTKDPDTGAPVQRRTLRGKDLDEGIYFSFEESQISTVLFRDSE